MERSFWEARWTAGQIGFHEGAPNALLQAHAKVLEGCTRVYVPLCGKAIDLPFLQSRGHEVLGTELVHTAVEALFASLATPPVVTTEGPYRKHTAAGITVLEGDAFVIEPAHLGGPVDAVYDRAALVAVDPPTRAAYVRAIERVLRPGGRVLLVVFDYPQHLVAGPPWAVSDADVRDLYAAFDVELLGTTATTVGPKLLAAGVTSLEERAYLLVKR